MELRQTTNGKSVVKFNLAINRYGKGVDFIPVQVWGVQAENLVQYQQKGNQLAVEGSIRIDCYEDSEGNNRYSTYVLAQNIQFLDKKPISNNTEEEQTSQTSDPFEEFGEQVSIDDNFLD